MLDREARQFVFNQCPYKHNKVRMHTCLRCQNTLKELLSLFKATEMELASSVMKWWNETKPKEEPQFVKIASDLTRYPGHYTHITLLPGIVIRTLYQVLLWGGCIGLGYLIFR